MIPSLVTNITHPAPVIQSETTQYVDFLPLVFLLIGAYLTYYINIKLERNKREYEFKKQTYLELLSSILENNKIVELLNEENEKVTDDQQKTALRQFQFILFKLELCNSSKEIQDKIRKITEDEYILDKLELTKDEIFSNWIPIIKSDLRNNSWRSYLIKLKNHILSRKYKT